MIHYQKQGSGETTLVLVHGFCENNTCLKRQVLFFKDHCKVIAPDLPGFGMSAVDNAATMESMADDIHKILEFEGIENCIMLGHSMGGYVTLAFAKKYPEVLKGFGLIHSTAFEDSEERIAKRRQVSSFIEEQGLGKFIDNFIPSLFLDPQSESINELLEEAKLSSKEGVLAAINAMMQRPNNISVLQNSNVPILFVGGESDPIIPIKDIYYQYSLCSRAKLLVLKNAAHMGMIEEADTLNKEIKNFLEFCS